MPLVPFHQLAGEIHRIKDVETPTAIEAWYEDERGQRAIILYDKED